MDASSNVYVADRDNNRIQKFTASGAFASTWGSQGSEDGQFEAPVGLAVDGSGNVYVVDQGNCRIQTFTASGGFLAKWGGPGVDEGQFDHPHGIATDTAGNVYVADSWNDRIQKFTSSGTFVAAWGNTGQGDGDGDLKWPEGVAVDASGNVYVTDTGNYRVQKFTASGRIRGRVEQRGHERGGGRVRQYLRRLPPGSTVSRSSPRPGSTWQSGDRMEPIADSSNTRTGSRWTVPATSTWRTQEATACRSSGLCNHYQTPRAVVVAGGGPFPGNSLWDRHAGFR